MEPIEINAGNWYLRALRADERVDDRPALAELGEHDDGYVGRRADDWNNNTCYTWAVCEPTTGELLAETLLDPRDGSISSRSRTGHSAAAQTAEEAVRRFARGALGLQS
ncbi:MAG: hypothetical protein WBB07_12580 [Mycobacterium sp.]